jgi:hypothetical protein
MAIHLLERTQRNVVAWLGGEPAPETLARFSDRGAVLSKLEQSRRHEASYLGNLAALIVVLDVSQKLIQTLDVLDDVSRDVLDHGADIVVLASAQEVDRLIEIVRKYHLPINGLPSGIQVEWQDVKAQQSSPAMWFFERGTPWLQIAELVVKCAPSERANLSLKLTGDPVDDEHGRLIRRAFADVAYTCAHITALPSGYSGSIALKVQAERAAAKPMPYFVKIGKREDTIDEYNAYLIGVEPYIPYHLAPPLLKDLCCLGASKGILVEHYVTESENLISCAEGGRAVSAIACLFSRTLNAWHRSTCDKPLVDFVLRMIPSNVDSGVLARAKSVGDPLGIDVLRERLAALVKGITVSYGRIHGDLHGGNIRVRGNDAIIIDMEKHSDGPLLWDPACLEASLLIEGFQDDCRDAAKWYQSILSCYDGVLYDFWSHGHLTDMSSWFHVAINQIRLYAHAMERKDGEYAATLASALLWKASKAVARSDMPGGGASREREECRRGVAYLIAQGLISSLDQAVKPPPKC